MQIPFQPGSQKYILKFDAGWYNIRIRLRGLSQIQDIARFFLKFGNFRPTFINLK